MRKLQILTNSELETFDQCRAKHGYTYHEMLRPKVTAAPLSLGTMGHAGIKAGWLAVSTLELLRATTHQRLGVAREAVASAVETARSAAENDLQCSGADNLMEKLEELDENAAAAVFGAKYYFEQRRDDLDIERKIPVAIERPFSVVLPTPKGRPSIIEYSGVMDLVLYDPRYQSLQIEDNKFTKYNPSVLERKIALSTQLTGYLVALRLMQDSPVPNWIWPESVSSDVVRATTGRIAYNVIKSVVPSQPKINKNGMVSCAQIDTLPDYYAAALFAQETERNLPTSPEQMELLAKIRAKSCWFQQIEFFRGDDEIERWSREVHVKAREIRASERDPSLRVRNPGHCSSASSMSCPMAIVCMDPDSEATRKNSYRVATSRHEEVEQTTNGSQESNQNEFGF